MLEEFQLVYVFARLFVGFVKGMTSIGSGPLMTPLLLHFGAPPASAVRRPAVCRHYQGRRCLRVHQRKRNINWRVTGLLALGSVPASAATLWGMHSAGFDSHDVNKLITTLLGCPLMFTALAIAFKGKLARFGQHQRWREQMSEERQAALTVAIGLLLGAIVTIISISVGAIGTPRCFCSPLMATVRLVGTEIAHAVPLKLMAGRGHAGFGNVDWSLLTMLLIGSLPDICIGSSMAGRVGEQWLRPVLATMLLRVGRS